MNPAELTTAVTDLALGVAAAALAWRQPRRPVAGAGALRVVFVAAAVTALAGALFHGFRHAAPAAVLWTLWRIVLIGIATTSLTLLFGASRARCEEPRPLTWIAWSKAAIVWIYSLGHDSLTLAGLDLVVTLLILGGLEIRSAARRAPGARWFLAGILVTFVAIVLQASGVRRGLPWNHNDVFHLLQIGALWCFHRGALAATVTDGRARDTANKL